MQLANMILCGTTVTNMIEIMFRYYDILLAQFAVYTCEEKPHFAEAKKDNPKAKRSVKDALQHTSDFSQEMIFVQKIQDFAKVTARLSNLKVVSGMPHVHEAMKFISKVQTSEGVRHIPLLDLDIPVSENGCEIAKDVFVNLGVKNGAIINSGRSYHGWGLDLMAEHQWHEFMHKALLLDTIDRRWVGHRLLDNQANLRISPKWGKLPVVDHLF